MSRPRLDSHFVVLKPDLGADTVEATDTIYAELDERYDGFKGASLVAKHSFASDWPTWEMHPAGDELVCLLSGNVDMVFASPDGEESVTLTKAGEFVVVPRGTWHTARVHAPTDMLFVTPGEGTENRKSLPWKDAGL